MSYCRPAGLSDDDDDDDEFEFSPDNNKQRVYLDETPQSKENLFYTALKNEEIDVMESMLASGFHVDQPLSGGWSPLMYACSLGSLSVVEYLIEAHANVNFSKELFTPMMALSQSRSVNENELLTCLDILLMHGANINATDKNACTSLMYACTSGHIELVKRLVDHKCDVNIQDTEGWSALFYAVNGGREDIIKVLLGGSARLDLIDRRRRTAFQIAMQKGYEHLGMLVCSRTEKRKLLANSENFPSVDKTVARDSVQELISQLPRSNAKSISGFSADVKQLLLAMQLGHCCYQFSAKNVQLNEFLLITDGRLKELGVRFSVHRQRILNSIRKFHLHQWNKASLGLKPRNQQNNVEDGVRLMCNVTKHLHILNATVNYVRIHQPIPIRLEVFKMCENVIHQLNLINGELKVLHYLASNLEHKEKIEPVDLIKPKTKTQIYFIPILVTSVFIGFVLWKRKIPIALLDMYSVK